MNCQYCEKKLPKKNTQFCDKTHESLWHKENGGNTFTAYINDSADIVEDRKARMQEYHIRHPLACAGDKEARRWMRQVMRLRAIWDNEKKKEIRL